MNAPRIRVDRTTVFVLIAAVLVIAAYAGLVSLAQQYYTVTSATPSVYGTDSAGLSVYFRYLDELGYAPTTLKTMEQLPAKATIIAAGPFENPPTPAEGRALVAWVRGGGRLVLAGTDGATILRGSGLGGSPSAGDSTDGLPPDQPGALSRGVSTMKPGTSRVLSSDPGWVDEYRDGKGAAMLSAALGEGEVVWLADTYAISNGGIGAADDAALAVAMAVAGRPIYFDEYHHGFSDDATVWDRLGYGGQAATVLLLVALVLLFVATARRTGPAIAEVDVAQARTGAYIGQLAELYRKAGARADALSSLEDGLNRALTRRHGSLEAGLKHHDEAREALLASAALRAGGSISKDAFIQASRRIRRARQEVEGRHG
jgi:hypothetical protein